MARKVEEKDKNKDLDSSSKKFVFYKSVEAKDINDNTVEVYQVENEDTIEDLERQKSLFEEKIVEVDNKLSLINNYKDKNKDKDKK